MNWINASRHRGNFKDNKRKQKEFFERRRSIKNLPQSPRERVAKVSQDLLFARSVRQIHGEGNIKPLDEKSRAPRTITHHTNLEQPSEAHRKSWNVELGPDSPTSSRCQSKLLINEANHTTMGLSYKNDVRSEASAKWQNSARTPSQYRESRAAHPESAMWHTTPSTTARPPPDSLSITSDMLRSCLRPRGGNSDDFKTPMKPPNSVKWHLPDSDKESHVEINNQRERSFLPGFPSYNPHYSLSSSLFTIPEDPLPKRRADNKSSGISFTRLPVREAPTPSVESLLSETSRIRRERGMLSPVRRKPFWECSTPELLGRSEEETRNPPEPTRISPASPHRVSSPFDFAKPLMTNFGEAKRSRKIANDSFHTADLFKRHADLMAPEDFQITPLKKYRPSDHMTERDNLYRNVIQNKALQLGEDPAADFILGEEDEQAVLNVNDWHKRNTKDHINKRSTPANGVGADVDIEMLFEQPKAFSSKVHQPRSREENIKQDNKDTGKLATSQTQHPLRGFVEKSELTSRPVPAVSAQSVAYVNKHIGLGLARCSPLTSVCTEDPLKGINVAPSEKFSNSPVSHVFARHEKEPMEKSASLHSIYESPALGNRIISPINSPSEADTAPDFTFDEFQDDDTTFSESQIVGYCPMGLDSSQTSGYHKPATHSTLTRQRALMMRPVASSTPCVGSILHDKADQLHSFLDTTATSNNKWHNRETEEAPTRAPRTPILTCPEKYLSMDKENSSAGSFDGDMSDIDEAATQKDPNAISAHRANSPSAPLALARKSLDVCLQKLSEDFSKPDQQNNWYCQFMKEKAARSASIAENEGSNDERNICSVLNEGQLSISFDSTKLSEVTQMTGVCPLDNTCDVHLVKEYRLSQVEEDLAEETANKRDVIDNKNACNRDVEDAERDGNPSQEKQRVAASKEDIQHGLPLPKNKSDERPSNPDAKSPVQDKPLPDIAEATPSTSTVTKPALTVTQGSPVENTDTCLKTKSVECNIWSGPCPPRTCDATTQTLTSNDHEGVDVRALTRSTPELTDLGIQCYIPDPTTCEPDSTEPSSDGETCEDFTKSIKSTRGERTSRFPADDAVQSEPFPPASSISEYISAVLAQSASLADSTLDDTFVSAESSHDINSETSTCEPDESRRDSEEIPGSQGSEKEDPRPGSIPTTDCEHTINPNKPGVNPSQAAAETEAISNSAKSPNLDKNTSVCTLEENKKTAGQVFENRYADIPDCATFAGDERERPSQSRVGDSASAKPPLESPEKDVTPGSHLSIPFTTSRDNPDTSGTTPDDDTKEEDWEKEEEEKEEEEGEEEEEEEESISYSPLSDSKLSDSSDDEMITSSMRSSPSSRSPSPVFSRHRRSQYGGTKDTSSGNTNRSNASVNSLKCICKSILESIPTANDLKADKSSPVEDVGVIPDSQRSNVGGTVFQANKSSPVEDVGVIPDSQRSNVGGTVFQANKSSPVEDVGVIPDSQRSNVGGTVFQANKSSPVEDVGVIPDSQGSNVGATGFKASETSPTEAIPDSQRAHVGATGLKAKEISTVEDVGVIPDSQGTHVRVSGFKASESSPIEICLIPDNQGAHATENPHRSLRSVDASASQVPASQKEGNIGSSRNKKFKPPLKRGHGENAEHDSLSTPSTGNKQPKRMSTRYPLRSK